jgi:hypothetical protein
MTSTKAQGAFPAQRDAGARWRLAFPEGGMRRVLGLLLPDRASRRPAFQTFRLGDNATLGLRPGRGGLVLTCQSGMFVVTQAGDPDDHVIESGDAFRTGARGRVVAWALRAGVIVCNARR